MLASVQSHHMISVRQMDPKSLAKDTNGDFYSSSAETRGAVRNLQETHQVFSAHGTATGLSLI